MGRKMVEFPLDPPLAKMLLTGAELGCAAEVRAPVRVGISKLMAFVGFGLKPLNPL